MIRWIIVRRTETIVTHAKIKHGWCTLTSSSWRGEKVLKHREGKRGIVNSWARPSRYVTSFDFASFKQLEDRLRQGLGVHRVSINNATFNLAWGIGFVSLPLGNDVLKSPCKWSNTTVSWIIAESGLHPAEFRFTYFQMRLALVTVKVLFQVQNVFTLFF